MKKTFAIFFCVAALFSAVSVGPAVAQEDTLTKNCMGGEDPRKDPQRAEYCACMSQSLSSLSPQEFKQIADEAAKAQSAGQEPPKLQELAKACITRVMGAPPQ